MPVMAIAAVVVSHTNNINDSVAISEQARIKEGLNEIHSLLGYTQDSFRSALQSNADSGSFQYRRWVER